MEKKYDKFIVEGALRLLTGLHIGTGRMSVETDATVAKDAQGYPYIPGSSLKGVLRTLSERFHHLVLPAPRTPVCFLAEDNCSTGKRSEQIRKNIEQYDQNNEQAIEKVIEEEVCPVCQLYGSQFRASKIIVRDSFLCEKKQLKKHSLTTVRHSVAIDRDTGAAKDGAKYDYEVVREGLQFQFTLEGEQLNDQDEKLLFIALQQLASGNVHLGGKVSRGLGLVKLENIHIYTYNFDKETERKAYLQFLIEGKHVQEQIFAKWKEEVLSSL
jgi:CRISPR-associated protein Csm3